MMNCSAPIDTFVAVEGTVFDGEIGSRLGVVDRASVTWG